jgi:very-short-patch-repair endonuclease
MSYFLNCNNCQKDFPVSRSKYSFRRSSFKLRGIKIYCSKECRNTGTNRNDSVNVTCKNCNVEFKKGYYAVKHHPNHFCTKSCAAKYNNTHKTHGTRRSKLEVWLEEQLSLNYPNLEIHFNRKDTINSELDIYIPSMKLAFELNGIYHYEPIHGSELLERIQNNDNRKFQACLERGIEFCIIDSSSLTYFKPTNAKKYLDIICKLISEKKCM